MERQLPRFALIYDRDKQDREGGTDHERDQSACEDRTERGPPLRAGVLTLREAR
jgi:hypothetical protein